VYGLGPNRSRQGWGTAAGAAVNAAASDRPRRTHGHALQCESRAAATHPAHDQRPPAHLRAHQHLAGLRRRASWDQGDYGEAANLLVLVVLEDDADAHQRFLHQACPPLLHRHRRLRRRRRLSCPRLAFAGKGGFKGLEFRV
jgi:hypothetical protein